MNRGIARYSPRWDRVIAPWMNPFEPLAPSRFMDRFLRGITADVLPLNVYETGEEVVVEALVPGASAEQIKVEYDAGVLTLHVTSIPTESPEGVRWFVREIEGGEYSRSISLPSRLKAEDARSTFKDGVLTLHLPKVPEARPTSIKIES